MDAPVQAPEDFASFVAEYADRVRTACATLTGNDRLATSLQQDLFASVALRWWWLRRQPPQPFARAGAAASYLQRQLRREAANWRPEDVRAPAPDLTVGPRRGQAIPHTQEMAELATNAWDRAHHIRVRRRRVGAIALVVVVLAAIALPRTNAGRQRPDADQGTPLPTIVPASVDIVGRFDQLGNLPAPATPLPTAIDMDAGAATPLDQSPVTRAKIVAQLESGPLIIVSEEGSVRKVDDTALGGARLLTTSLSPDGTRVAMVKDNGLLIVDLTTGALRSLGTASAARPATGTLVWRTARTVLVPARSGAQVVNVDSGQIINLSGLSGTNVVTMQGPEIPTTPVELVPSNPSSAQPARIRIWRSEPPGTPGPNGFTAGGVGPSASAAPNGTPSATPSSPPTSVGSPSPGPSADASAVEDRPIFGPPWIGRWGGAGWGNSTLFTRPCDPSALTLPEDVGVAGDTLGAVDDHGLYRRTLVTVEQDTRMESLGFLDAQTVLVSVSKASRTWLLGWDTRSGDLRAVTSVNADAQVSVPDLLRA